MKIVCTVSEFANLVRGCYSAQTNNACSKCTLYNICRNYAGSVEQFVVAEDITDDEEEE